jgi:hypothetical protein
MYFALAGAVYVYLRKPWKLGLVDTTVYAFAVHTHSSLHFYALHSYRFNQPYIKIFGKNCLCTEHVLFFLPLFPKLYSITTIHLVLTLY